MKEKQLFTINGSVALVILLDITFLCYLFLKPSFALILKDFESISGYIMPTIIVTLLIPLWLGLSSVEIGESWTATFLGDYIGTSRESGFIYFLPFVNYRYIDARLRQTNTDIIKVNDKNGNPIEIQANIVWKVTDCAKATFEVEDFEDTVNYQSESALRDFATRYNYDELVKGGINSQLEDEVNERIAFAGCEIEECRVTHLAYDPAIAALMLRRQQADATIEARTKIVEGLSKVAIEAAQKISGVSGSDLAGNLLLVMMSDKPVTPTMDLKKKI